MGILDHHKSINVSYVKSYDLQPWGELIYGTKEQLQALGIGVDVQFPAKRNTYVRVKDPRGFKTKISCNSYLKEGIYSASISYPDRDRPDKEWASYAPGVRVRKYVWFDEYNGTAEALVSAGVIQLRHSPGQPGMGKIQVTLSPDKEPVSGPQKRMPGHTIINRVSKSNFRVRVVIPLEERELRQEAHARRDEEWENKMAALPRPAPLTPMTARALLTKRHELARNDKKFQALIAGIVGPD